MNDDRTEILFREQRYLCVRGFLPEPVLEFLKVYCRILRTTDRLSKEDPYCLARGGDPGLVGFDVAPTYSYLRVYGRGATLPRHIDREACEISVTVSIEIPEGAPPSILHLKPPSAAETAIPMEEGDGCVYAAMEVEHWRETIPADGYSQLFLHFIDKRAETFPRLLYDRRKFLGAPFLSDRRGGRE
jgi:hypothetical protein